VIQRSVKYGADSDSELAPLLFKAAMARTLLQFTNIDKSYGAQAILNGLSVTISEDQKIGVIGRNGAGKTTLCRIITGHETQDAGTVQNSRYLRLAYLEQYDPYKLDETVISFLARYTNKEEWECGKIAAKFQLKNEIFETTINELAGGFRTRVKLAAMLLMDPNFLILDEPTNYLDLKTLILLEEFLQDYRGGFLIVSHDREFLKKTCQETLEIENGTCVLYPGRVDEYLIFKEEQARLIDCQNKNIDIKRKQMQAFVDRFRAKASKASQAKSMMKRIDKLQAIDTGHFLRTVHFKIPHVEKRNISVFHAENLAIGYAAHQVAGNITMEFNQGDHIAVLGDNGQGKTTFMRTIAGDLEAIRGLYKWGHGLKIGYYAQHVLQALDIKNDVLTHLSAAAEKSVTRQDILAMAGSFLFKGDDVLKKVSVLSGGEKARLCLASLLLSKSNVLLFDEPTNHLDFETVEALARALKSYNGTIFFISHDRTFVNMLATRIIEVKDGAVRCYPGNYEEYVYNLESKVCEELRADTDNEPKPRPVAKPHKTEHKRQDRNLIKKLKAEQLKINSNIRDVQVRIDRHRAEWEQIKNIFAVDSSSWSIERNSRYEYLERAIKQDEAAWLSLMEKAEELTKKITAS